MITTNQIDVMPPLPFGSAPLTGNMAYIEDGEVKLQLATDDIEIEEARRLLHKVVELEYSLP